MRNKLTLQEVIEISKQPMYKDNYVIACTDLPIENKYNWLVVPTVDLVEKWYETFCDNFKSVVIYRNGRYLHQPNKMN